MGDLKTNWTNPVLPDHGLDGQGIISRGSDPNADGGGEGEAALSTYWDASKQATTRTDQADSGNSVSGLPQTPNRWEPSENPPEPPSLQDRRPGTVDQR